LSVSLFRNPRKAKQQKEKKKRKKNRNGAKRNEPKKRKKRNETKKRNQTKEKTSTTEEQEEQKRNEKKRKDQTQKGKKRKKKKKNETEASYCDLALCLGFVVDPHCCRFLRQVALLLRLLQWARAPVGPRGPVFAKTETPGKNGKNAERPEKTNTMEEAR
jgi:DNA mismatch repair ATPase MutL